MATPLIPALAKLRTTAPPIPPAPPVTRAILPLNSIVSQDRKAALAIAPCRFSLVDHPTLRKLNQFFWFPSVTDCYTVIFFRLFGGDIALDHVPKYSLGVALEWIAIATAAWEVDVNSISGSEIHQCFAVQS